MLTDDASLEIRLIICTTVRIKEVYCWGGWYGNLGNRLSEKIGQTKLWNQSHVVHLQHFSLTVKSCLCQYSTKLQNLPDLFSFQTRLWMYCTLFLFLKIYRNCISLWWLASKHETNCKTATNLNKVIYFVYKNCIYNLFLEVVSHTWVSL